MACEHKNIRAVGYTLYCKDCGATLPENWLDDKQIRQTEKPVETPKKPVKRRAKKEAE